MNLNYILVTKALSEGLGKALLFSEALLGHTIKSYVVNNIQMYNIGRRSGLGPELRQQKGSLST